MFSKSKIYMLGIGGVSMSGIARILADKGYDVSGYDANKSDITVNLTKKGINVTYEKNLENIKNADIIVYTAAIKKDAEEIEYAKSLGKEIYERSTFLGILMKEYKNVLCISGTHGKSTTTGMVSEIFLKADLNPTILIGANLPSINGNVKEGSNEYLIAESCEFVDSFLEFFPTCEVILNIDDDHLDYFHSIDNIIKSFTKFTMLLKNNEPVIINNDDENTLIATKDVQNKITYGIKNTSLYMAKNIAFDDKGHPTFDLYIKNEFINKVTLNIEGIHNIYNCLAAIAISNVYIKDIAIIIKGVSEYHGVGRRFEYVGTYNNAKIYDDYAHHPSELIATLNSVINTKHNHTYAVFQCHTYSRTKDHLNEFSDILAKFENIIIASIYAAREKNIYDVHEEDLVNLIKEKGNNNVIYLDSFDKIKSYLKDKLKPDDLVITIGAGNINEVSKDLVKEGK